MGKVLTEIGPREIKFIQSQKVFFVATAPISTDHHVSVSPKAGGIVVVDPHTVIYGDLSGSGAETAAHVLQNGRMTLMFCNLEAGAPKILRLFGTATVYATHEAPARKWIELLPAEITESYGFRAIYKLNVTRISSSCGYALPIMEYKKHRSVLKEFTEKEGKEGMFDYMTKKNSFSIDGLPSVALLRKNAPDVVPVEEDGYIFGKSVNGIKKQKISFRTFRGGVLPSWTWSNAGFGMITFVLGLALGRTLSLPKSIRQ